MIFIQSKTGGRAENQDSYGSTSTPYGELLLICDGMGGHKGGKRASELAVQIIIDEMCIATKIDAAEALKSAIQLANTRIIEEGNRLIEWEKMGTTLVALLVTNEKAICCHVGDSRLYHLRGSNVLFRTFDHSHVFELVRAGLLTEEEARLSEKSNIITQALGIDLNLQIETTDNIAYQQGDRFLLCTDGIWGVLPEKELLEMAIRALPVDKIVSELVENIDTIGWEKGGKHDNLTAGMVEIESTTKVFINLRSNLFRVFLNFPKWVGMKVYEIEMKNGKIKCTLIDECTYQSENKNVCELYSEVTLYDKDLWKEIKHTDIFERCIYCKNKSCLDCIHALEYYSISTKRD